MMWKTMMWGVILLGCSAGTATAGSLETLERERSRYLDIAFDQQLTAEQRVKRLADRLPRLMDLERIVLRDDRMGKDVTAHARRAFANSDMTFLVHASAEQNRLPLDIWLEQVGLTSNAVLKARMGVK